MTELFAARDRGGQLRVFTSDEIVKNNGRGYWIPKYNSGVREFVIDENEFPEISWDDMSPTKLMLVNPKPEENIGNVSLPGTIEVSTPNSASPFNVKKGSKTTVFISDISYIESSGEETYKSHIHMKNGDIIQCEQSQYAVKQLIRESKP